MLIADLALARRLESHEAWSSVEHARVQAQQYPETGAASSLPIAGGHAVFCGRKSPLSQVFGWGLSGPVSSADLDTAEEFYRSRKKGTRVRVCPLADRSLVHLLGDRGYRVQDFMNVHARRMDAAGPLPPTGGDWRCQVATREQTQQWFEQVQVQKDWTEPDGVAFMTIRCALKEGTRFFLAWQGEQMAGGGALEIHEGVAALMAAETLPAFRNRGVQTALLRARLDAAAEAGCDLAMIHTTPNTTSQRNVLCAGFHLVYMTAGLVSPPTMLSTV